MSTCTDPDAGSHQTMTWDKENQVEKSDQITLYSSGPS